MIEILNDFSLIVRELLSHSNNDPTHTYTKGGTIASKGSSLAVFSLLTKAS